MILTVFDFVLLIALALIFARIMGFVFDRLKQPAVIGEIIAGIVLGGLGLVVFSGQGFSFLNLTFFLPQLNYNSWEFKLLAEIGILFLLFISGLQTSLPKLKKIEKPSLFVAVGGIFLPLILGIVVGMFFGFSQQDSIVIALILVATSVGVTVRTLMDLHALDSDVSVTILSSAVIDDVLGIILLAFILGIDSPIYIGIKIIIFLLIFLYLGLKIVDKILDLGEKIHLPKALLSISLAIFLLFSFFADKSGIAGIIGAFVAGLIIGHTLKSRKIIDDVRAIGYGFFIPLFFVWTGANLWVGASQDLSSFATIGLIALVIIIVAIVGKIVGCGIGAKLAGMKNRESLQIGVGMVPRMELALIIVSSAISHGMFSSPKVEHQILAVTILLTIATTLITPFLIKALF
ncbi:MAG: cation:proton antiporter [Thermoplasmatales archaeon]|nr:MAG: cation:proton antiporter [Thermoplasmatales archaeon]